MTWLFNMVFALYLSGILGWNQFRDVVFVWEYQEEVDAEVQMPRFGSKLKGLEGKQIELAGYYLPMRMNRKQIIISEQPFASCFFCGGDNGPESVAEVHFLEKPPIFTADEIVHVRGRLRLNPYDFDHLVFILEEAEIVE